jgi:carbon storage regulator
MLLLSRKALQQIMIGPDIRLTVVKVDRNQIRIGIEAPAGIAILRQELAGKPRPAGPAATHPEPEGGTPAGHDGATRPR